MAVNWMIDGGQACNGKTTREIANEWKEKKTDG